MTQSQSSLHRVGPRSVPIQERIHFTENFVGLNGYRVNRALLKQRFIEEGGYQCHETSHFLLFTHTQTSMILIMHWFAPEEIDNELGGYFIQELKPLGVVTTPKHFDEIFAAVVCSLFPGDAQRALHWYTTNTLRRYHQRLTQACNISSPYSTMDMFAALYKRVCELQVGESFLDAGCGPGFLPLLIAQRIPSLTQVIGIDVRSDAFPSAPTIAEERHLMNVQFVHADLLADDFGLLGHFDTVTALHVLEHFSEMQMYTVLTNLLKITTRRLMIAVPYEQEPETVYGHKQTFSHDKLETVGHWCLQQPGGESRMWCEDCVGGLLVIDARTAMKPNPRFKTSSV